MPPRRRGILRSTDTALTFHTMSSVWWVLLLIIISERLCVSFLQWVPQTGWLNTAGTYCLPIPVARGPNSRCGQGYTGCNPVSSLPPFMGKLPGFLACRRISSSPPSSHARVHTGFSCVWLCCPADCSPPGSSARAILQARILEWAAMPSSRGSSWPRDWTCVSYNSALASGLFTISATWEAPTSTCRLLIRTQSYQVRDPLCFSMMSLECN